jgi:hypothetical protein
MKRLTTTSVYALGFLILIAAPAHAIKTLVATIALGEVQVIGIQAKKNASISWEGNPVTQSNKLGAFLFSTTNLPIDCVGQLSDGVTTIPVVIFGCTTQQVTGGGVLKTGQTNNFGVTGSDGDLQKGTARSYTSNADGTITDNSTGLVWVKLTSDATIHDVNNVCTWAQAFQKVADLNTANFAGHNDWRLPNINELQTLTDWGRFNPAIDPVFNNGVDSFTQSSFYWSSTTYQYSPDIAWFVFFIDGGVYADFKFSLILYVRAVRGGS